MERTTAFDVFCALDKRGFSCTLESSDDRGYFVRAALQGKSPDELIEAINDFRAGIGTIRGEETENTCFENGYLVIH